LANKKGIEKDIEQAILNKQLLDESYNKILSNMDQIMSKLTELELKETNLLNEREDIEVQVNDLKNNYAEELGHFIEEKSLIKSIYEIDEEKSKYSKLIDSKTTKIN